MKTITLLADWRCVPLTIVARHRKDVLGVELAVYISPKNRLYRLAASWEQPDVLITAGVWSPDRDIRLVRVTDKRWRDTVRQKLEGS